MTNSAADILDWRNNTVHFSFVGEEIVEQVRDGSTLLLRNKRLDTESRWSLESKAQGLTLTWIDRKVESATLAEIYAAVEGAFTFSPAERLCHLRGLDTLLPKYVGNSVILSGVGNSFYVLDDMFWQQNLNWLRHARDQLQPLRYAVSHGYRHPLRPAKPEGVVYERFIPWLEKKLSFRVLDIDRDLALLHRWMNDPVVARIWQEQGDLDKHRQYLKDIEADPHMYPMIASIDGEPFAYFEVYWARENRIAPFCEADDYDRGWHVLVGESDFRGKGIATAWLTSISHYLFLDEPRTRRIVGEPRVDHVQQIRNLDRSGYAKVKEFDFPHKRAQLVVLLRERFFADALWWPRTNALPASAQPQIQGG